MSTEIKAGEAAFLTNRKRLRVVSVIGLAPDTEETAWIVKIPGRGHEPEVRVVNEEDLKPFELGRPDRSTSNRYSD